jgi:hypothetical protein
MAKVTITIEDKEDGNVKVVSDPNFETLMMMDMSGHRLTNAHGYAMAALLRIRERSKEIGQLNGRSIIHVPRSRLSH